MVPAPVKPFFPEEPLIRQLPPAEAAARLWATLEDHRAGCFADALAGWSQIRLPEETAHWREIAMGAAYLRVGDQECAAMHLEAARKLAPGHAVVAYFTALLRLEQAATAARVPDGLKNSQQVLVAYTPGEDKRQYEQLALDELRLAIARAGQVRLDQPLLVTDPQIDESVSVPRSGDLLVALGADNFVGKAHHVSFGLQLGRGELADAEFHLDQAAATGIAALYGYRDLAAVYLDEGRSTDVLRVMTKDLDCNQPWVRPLCTRLTEMARSAGQAPWVW
jgi:hypothetical protein